jgi:integrase
MSEFSISIQKDDRNIRKKPYLVRWSGEFNPHTGKQKRYSKSFEKRTYAERFAQRKKDEFEAGMSRDEVHITLEHLCTQFMRVHENTHTHGTKEIYENTINRLKAFFHPSVPIKTIQQVHAEEFIAQVNYVRKEYKGKTSTLSDSARNIHLRNAKRIFNKAKEWKYIIDNPFEKIKQVKPSRKYWHRITIDEFKRILENTHSLKDKAFYAIQYGCGLREGEALNILIHSQCIDFEKNMIRLYNRPATIDIPPFTLKDKESRTITMPNWVKDLLQQLYKEHDPEVPFLFMTTDRWKIVKSKWDKMRKEGNSKKWQNHHLGNNMIREFKKSCARAGIKTHEKLMLHCLRKSWACNLAENGIGNKTLLELGGWSDIRVLDEFYSKASDANKKKAVEVLDRLMGE